MESSSSMKMIAGAFAGLLEEVAHATGADAHEQLDELEALKEKNGTPPRPRLPAPGASCPFPGSH